MMIDPLMDITLYTGGLTPSAHKGLIDMTSLQDGEIQKLPVDSKRLKVFLLHLVQTTPNVRGDYRDCCRSILILHTRTTPE
jgi:hypothetical protein